MLPTPRATDGTKGGPNQRGSSGDLMLPSAVQLLGTPTARDFKGDGLEWRLDAAAERGHLEAQVRLLPTPLSSEGTKPSNTMGVARRQATGEVFLTNVIVSQFGSDPHELPSSDHGTWGQYAAAIHRWEQVTRPAPPPTETGPKGNPRLSAAFSEWMMGLPAGWVTDVPGITRNEALRAIGNGACPQQAEAAVRFLLGVSQAVA